MTISIAKEATASSAGDNKACSDRGHRKDKHSGSQRYRAETRTEHKGFSEMGPLCYGNRQGEELLCLWRFWIYSLLLQEQRKRKANGKKKDGIQWRMNQEDF